MIAQLENTTRSTRTLAGIGVSLLAVAAVSLVSNRWELFGPSVRLGVLLGASAVVLVVATTLRRITPATSRALDVLVAVLAPVDAAAVVVVTGGTWRSALIAAGPATVLASEPLRRRGESRWLVDGATAIGGALLCTGVAATFDLPAPILVAGLGAVTILVRASWHGRSVGLIWAGAAGLTPALRVLDEVAFTGTGVMREIGLLDAASVTDTIVTGTIAAIALGSAAWRDRAPLPAFLAVASAGAAGIQVWATYEPPATVALLAVAIVAGLAEVGFAARRWAEVPSRIREAVETANTILLAFLTLVVGAMAWSHAMEDGIATADAPYTAAVLGLGWLVGDGRRIARREVWAATLPGVAVAAMSAVALATDRHDVVGLVVFGLGVLAFALRRPFRDAVALTAFVVAPAVVYDVTVLAGLLGAGSTLGIVLIARRVVAMTVTLNGVPVDRTDARLFAGVAGSAGLLILALGGGSVSEWDLVVGGLYLVIGGWTAAELLDGRVPVIGWLYRGLAYVGLVVVAVDHRWLGAATALLITVLHEWDAAAMNSRLHRIGTVVSLTTAWMLAADALDVSVAEVYLYPPLWLGAAALVASDAIGDDPPWTILVPALVFSAGISVLGRVDDGRAVHLVLLGCVCLLVAGWGAARNDRVVLAVAGAGAVAVAVFEGLARSVGVETWGWLVIGGLAAVTAAGLLEARGAPAAEDASVT